METYDHVHAKADRNPVRLPLLLGFLGLLAVALSLLWGEHRVHVLSVLPYLLLLACPAMHLFMQHGHREDQPPRRVEGASPRATDRE